MCSFGKRGLIFVDTIQSELCKKDLGEPHFFDKPEERKLIGIDILQKQIIAEEATVRKAGGKFKMNPLFPSTTAKIKEVCLLPSKYLFHSI